MKGTQGPSGLLPRVSQSTDHYLFSRAATDGSSLAGRLRAAGDRGKWLLRYGSLLPVMDAEASCEVPAN